MPAAPDPDVSKGREPSLIAADIFSDALERPPAERDEFLRRACAGNPGLLAEVESLLRAQAGLEAAERVLFLRRAVRRTPPDADEPTVDEHPGVLPADCAESDADRE